MSGQRVTVGRGWVWRRVEGHEQCGCWLECILVECGLVRESP